MVARFGFVRREALWSTALDVRGPRVVQFPDLTFCFRKAWRLTHATSLFPREREELLVLTRVNTEDDFLLTKETDGWRCR